MKIIASTSSIDMILLLLALAACRVRSFVSPPPNTAAAAGALRSSVSISGEDRFFRRGMHSGDRSMRGIDSRHRRESSSRLSALAKDLSGLTVVELKGLLRAQGSRVSGRKAELIQRLSAASFETVERVAEPAAERPGPVAVLAGEREKEQEQQPRKRPTILRNIANRRSISGGGTQSISRGETVTDSRRQRNFDGIDRPDQRERRGSGSGTRDDNDANPALGLDAEFDSIFGLDSIYGLADVPELEPALERKRKRISADIAADATTEPARERKRTSAADATVTATTTSPTTSTASNDAATAGGFSDMGLPQLVVRRLTQMGLTEPTPIQREAIPIALNAVDVMGLAQTGTGKTIAFGVPLVSKLLSRGKNGVVPVSPKGVAALVLAPTRELANQIAEQLRSLTEGSPVRTMVVVGGQNIQTQTNKLKAGTHILVATPGRLLDLMDRGALTLRGAGFLVLDEADMMLDMGFAPDLKRVVRQISSDRQTMLFSATMSPGMADVAKLYLRKPVRVEVARAGKTADKITQALHYVAKPDKMSKLLSLLGKHGDPTERTLVFGRTKHGMEKLSQRLVHAGIKAGSIHGNKSQPQRDRAIRDFKSGAMNVLVATDVAARGLDIPDVKHVYNYELPNQPESYVHRIGRTARAGKDGAAIAFCSMEEMDDLAKIQKVVGIQIPVASGSPWSRRDSTRAKDAIKERKQSEQIAHRMKKSTQRRYRGR